MKRGEFILHAPRTYQNILYVVLKVVFSFYCMSSCAYYNIVFGRGSMLVQSRCAYLSMLRLFKLIPNAECIY